MKKKLESLKSNVELLDSSSLKTEVKGGLHAFGSYLWLGRGDYVDFLCDTDSHGKRPPLYQPLPDDWPKG